MLSFELETRTSSGPERGVVRRGSRRKSINFGVGGMSGLSTDSDMCSSLKIGIVGRTGAGKSSCLQALFRLVELSKGTITVDGKDISMLGLDTLRQSMSAIPQEPLLFSGSMRENLDPEGRNTDAQLHDALRRCHLIADEARDNERLAKFRLDAEVADEGKNFS